MQTGVFGQSEHKMVISKEFLTNMSANWSFDQSESKMGLSKWSFDQSECKGVYSIGWFLQWSFDQSEGKRVYSMEF